MTYMETEVIEWVKGQPKPSELIERLIRKEMEKNSLKGLSIEQLKALKAIREEKKAIEAKERELWTK